MKHILPQHRISWKKASRRQWLVGMLVGFVALFITICVQSCSLIQAKPIHEKSTQKNVDIVWAVASDLHVMDTSIVKRPGKAFEEYLKNDRKLLSYSRVMLDSLSARMLILKPKYLLISGDLTKDGAYVSHQYLIHHFLAPLREAGIQPIVVPGNHDIMNPHAYIYDGDKSVRTRTINPDEFRELYGPYGYNQALSNDSSSLSYVLQLSPKVRLLCLDANQYKKNDFNLDLCYWNGVLSESTLAYVAEQAHQAQKLGMRMMIMIHHGVIPHWRLQNQASPGYVLDNASELRRLCYTYNIEICMTGHAHCQDISEHSYWGSHLYDIETGSLVTYPCPYRVMRLHGDSLSIVSDSIEIGSGFEDIAKEALIEGVATFSLSSVSKSFPDTLRKHIATDIGRLMVVHAHGDEVLSDKLQQDLIGLDHQMRHYSFLQRLRMSAVIKSLSKDSGVADNDVDLELSPVIAMTNK